MFRQSKLPSFLNMLSRLQPQLEEQQQQQSLMDNYRTPIYDEMASRLRTPPERNNPGMMRKIGAAIVGMGAGLKPAGSYGGQPFGAMFNPQASTAATEDFLYRPYNREMNEYEAELDRLGKGAQIESTNVNNQRLLRRQMQQEDIENRRLTRQEERDLQLAREHSDRMTRDERRIAVTEEANNIRRMVAEKPNMKTFTGEDGYIYIQDIDKPDSPATRTTIKSNELSDLQKLEIGHTNDLARIRAQGAEQRQTNNERPTTPSGGGGNAQLEATRAIQNRARAVISAFPELRNYISEDGVIAETPPARTMFGTRDNSAAIAARQRAYDLMYGKDKDKDPATLVNAPRVAVPTPEVPAPTNDKVEVINPQGQRGRIPRSQLEAALAQGYKAVQ